MGIQSKLRNNSQARVLYDRDKVPEGLDPDIWHLALLFEQAGNDYGHDVIGRPIVYTELSNRITASGIRNSSHWTGIMEDMIHVFWDYIADPHKADYALNEFCNTGTFDDVRQSVINERARELLLDTGTRTRQPDITTLSPSKKSSHELAVKKILMKNYTQEELISKLKAFKERS
jgi:hypothetical protein